MGKAKFIYDSKTIELPDLYGFEPGLVQERYDNFSASGVHESIVSEEEHDKIRLDFRNMTPEEVYALYDWWSYARLGNSFAFALDGSLDEATTLDGAAASGQKNVPLTSTTGFSAGDWCLIKQALSAGDDYEAIQIDSVDAGVKIVSETNLLNTYASGDIFRHMHYWPEVIVEPGSFSLPRTSPGRHISFSIALIEVR